MFTSLARGLYLHLCTGRFVSCRFNGFDSYRSRNRSGREEKFFQNISPAKGPDGTPARQVGFMSTQRWEDRSILATQAGHRETWSWQLTDSKKRACAARHVCTAAEGRTASLLSILWSAMAWLATKFLQTDHLIRQLARPRLRAERRGSPPPSLRCGGSLNRQASPRSSIPHIPDPSGPARLHPPLPQFPAVHQSGLRVERYDGKRDMYFQHAA